MGNKTNLKFLWTVFCFALGVFLFAFQSCSRDQSSANQPESLGISCYDNSPTWSPDGNRIAFHSSRDGNREIYVMNADGSNQTRLTDNPAHDFGPSWSPDGSRIAFVSDRDGDWNIYTMDADGSNQIRLMETYYRAYSGNWAKPSWSPDRLWIAFGLRREGNLDIYIMNADGSNQTRLTENPARDFNPSWSLDGTKIAFVSNRDGNAEIYNMNADGSNPIRLTDNPAFDLGPSWSPDGSRIVFFSRRDGNPEIYAMDPDGSNLIRLTDNRANDVYPSWSPDGQKIVFETDRDLVDQVYVMDADGSNPLNLTNNAPLNAAYGLAPFPQSELDLDNIPYRLVFQSFRETDGKENWEICLIDANGSDLINLTNTPDIDEKYPHASPDGCQICFEAHEGENEEGKSRNVYYMNIDGTGRILVAENAYQPCWGPDGRHIAYLPGEYSRYNPSNSANKGIAFYDIETGETKNHPNENIMHIVGPCWSMDGEWIVAGWVAFKVDDKTVMKLTMTGCTPDISSDVSSLVWNGSDWSLNIGKLDLDSPKNSVTGHKMVVACERDFWIYHADWSADEKFLAFTYGFDDEGKKAGERKPWSHVCICDLNTGKWTQITTDGKYNEQPDWVPFQVDR
jgi:Tol biopolymer transport system component